MAKPKGVTWPLEDHTRVKHEILRRYLDAWYPIMLTSQGSVLIVDGFAGPGEYDNGEPGSPIIMIDSFLKHSYDKMRQKQTNFLFIEEDPKRCENLKGLLDARAVNFPPTTQFELFQGTFQNGMSKTLNAIDACKLQVDAMFVFIDPFGYSHTPMKLIKRILSYPKSEVLITLMSEEINRFLKADYNTKETQYTDLFGTEDWKNIMVNVSNSRERMLRQHTLYQTQLINMGGAKYVRSFRMRNKNNAVDYFLFFGTKHVKGMEVMKGAMYKVDPWGDYDFSDFTKPEQPVLFEPEPDYTPLTRLLTEQFKNKTITIEEIHDFVITKTPYIKYKKEALEPMEKASPSKIQVFSTNPKRKPFTYADGKTRIRFL